MAQTAMKVPLPFFSVFYKRNDSYGIIGRDCQHVSLLLGQRNNVFSLYKVSQFVVDISVTYTCFLRAFLFICLIVDCGRLISLLFKAAVLQKILKKH